MWLRLECRQIGARHSWVRPWKERGRGAARLRRDTKLRGRSLGGRSRPGLSMSTVVPRHKLLINTSGEKVRE